MTVAAVSLLTPEHRQSYAYCHSKVSHCDSTKSALILSL